MTLLPFKISSIAKTETFTVEDGLGHSLDIPKYGCLTVEEMEIYYNYTLETVNTKGDSLPYQSYQVELIYRLLKSRFNLPDTVTKKELFTLENGDPLGESMVKALFDFFEQERLRWVKEPVVSTGGKKLTGTKSTTV
jgi:hypothetical protein